MLLPFLTLGGGYLATKLPVCVQENPNLKTSVQLEEILDTTQVEIPADIFSLASDNGQEVLKLNWRKLVDVYPSISEKMGLEFNSEFGGYVFTNNSETPISIIFPPLDKPIALNNQLNITKPITNQEKAAYLEGVTFTEEGVPKDIYESSTASMLFQGNYVFDGNGNTINHDLNENTIVFSNNNPHGIFSINNFTIHHNYSTKKSADGDYWCTAPSAISNTFSRELTGNEILFIANNIKIVHHGEVDIEDNNASNSQLARGIDLIQPPNGIIYSSIRNTVILGFPWDSISISNLSGSNSIDVIIDNVHIIQSEVMQRRRGTGISFARCSAAQIQISNSFIQAAKGVFLGHGESDEPSIMSFQMTNIHSTEQWGISADNCLLSGDLTIESTTNNAVDDPTTFAPGMISLLAQNDSGVQSQASLQVTLKIKDNGGKNFISLVKQFNIKNERRVLQEINFVLQIEGVLENYSGNIQFPILPDNPLISGPGQLDPDYGLVYLNLLFDMEEQKVYLYDLLNERFI